MKLNVSKTIYKYILVIIAIFGMIALQSMNILYANDVKFPNLTNDILQSNTYRNKVFTYTGVVRNYYINKYGIITIYFNDLNMNNILTASIFPNLGVIDKNILITGSKIQITGTVKEYINKKNKIIYQIMPLDKGSIKLIELANYCKNTIEVKDIAKNIGKNVNLKFVKVISNEEYVSKKGTKMQKVKLLIKDMVFDGVIWHDKYTDNVKEILKNNSNNICINAEVSQFRGDISLLINSVSNP